MKKSELIRILNEHEFDAEIGLIYKDGVCVDLENVFWDEELFTVFFELDDSFS